MKKFFKKKTLTLFIGMTLCLILFSGCSVFPDKYQGQWHEKENQDISIDIVKEDTKYFITITATQDEDSIFFWELEAEKDGDSIVYENAEKYSVTYDNYGNAVEEELYTDGKGSFSKKGKNLIWEDKTESFAKDLYFIQ